MPPPATPNDGRFSPGGRLVRLNQLPSASIGALGLAGTDAVHEPPRRRCVEPVTSGRAEDSTAGCSTARRYRLEDVWLAASRDQDVG